MRWLMFALLLGSGCKQGVGDRCNVDGDCDDGLVCDRAGQPPQTGGTCKAPASVSTDLAIDSSSGDAL